MNEETLGIDTQSHSVVDEGNGDNQQYQSHGAEHDSGVAHILVHLLDEVALDIDFVHCRTLCDSGTDGIEAIHRGIFALHIHLKFGTQRIHPESGD